MRAPQANHIRRTFGRHWSSSYALDDSRRRFIEAERRRLIGHRPPEAPSPSRTEQKLCHRSRLAWYPRAVPSGTLPPQKAEAAAMWYRSDRKIGNLSAGGVASVLLSPASAADWPGGVDTAEAPSRVTGELLSMKGDASMTASPENEQPLERFHPGIRACARCGSDRAPGHRRSHRGGARLRARARSGNAGRGRGPSRDPGDPGQARRLRAGAVRRDRSRARAPSRGTSVWARHAGATFRLAGFAPCRPLGDVSPARGCRRPKLRAPAAARAAME
jgi:hypothetical protein